MATASTQAPPAESAQPLQPAGAPAAPKVTAAAQKNAGPAVELSFTLEMPGCPPKKFTLRGLTQRITIGRRPTSDCVLTARSVSFDHVELFLQRKGRDPMLTVRDVSKNMTGVRSARASVSNEPYHELRKAEVQVLQHRSQLRIPFHTKHGAAGGKENESLITTMTVRFVLPDMYCEYERSGRWDFIEKLGEGGLAVVYRARDMSGPLQSVGEVAVKISKFSNLLQASQQNRHIYALHREAQWSLQRIHCESDKRYDSAGATLFAHYLEDHTGFAAHSNGDFDADRVRFESPDFKWDQYSFSPGLPSRPYVVMELIKGRLLQQVMEGQPPLTNLEKSRIVRQCSEALVYMNEHGVIHRDFRGCNLFLQDRGPECKLKVIDLGFMISLTPGTQAKNPNAAVRCAWQGDPARKLRFDWAPPEVLLRGSVNFGEPGCSFDAFSFGVLILKLLRGRSWTQEKLAVKCADLSDASSDVEAIGLSMDLLYSLLDHTDAGKRPLPQELLQALRERQLWAAVGGKAAPPPSRSLSVALKEPLPKRAKTAAAAAKVSLTQPANSTAPMVEEDALAPSPSDTLPSSEAGQFVLPPGKENAKFSSPSNADASGHWSPMELNEDEPEFEEVAAAAAPVGKPSPASLLLPQLPLQGSASEVPPEPKGVIPREDEPPLMPLAPSPSPKAPRGEASAAEEVAASAGGNAGSADTPVPAQGHDQSSGTSSDSSRVETGSSSSGSASSAAQDQSRPQYAPHQMMPADFSMLQQCQPWGHWQAAQAQAAAYMTAMGMGQTAMSMGAPHVAPATWVVGHQLSGGWWTPGEAQVAGTSGKRPDHRRKKERRSRKRSAKSAPPPPAAPPRLNKKALSLPLFRPAVEVSHSSRAQRDRLAAEESPSPTRQQDQPEVQEASSSPARQEKSLEPEPPSGPATPDVVSPREPPEVLAAMQTVQDMQQLYAKIFSQAAPDSAASESAPQRPAPEQSPGNVTSEPKAPSSDAAKSALRGARTKAGGSVPPRSLVNSPPGRWQAVRSNGSTARGTETTAAQAFAVARPKGCPRNQPLLPPPPRRETCSRSRSRDQQKRGTSKRRTNGSRRRSRSSWSNSQLSGSPRRQRRHTSRNQGHSRDRGPTNGYRDDAGNRDSGRQARLKSRSTRGASRASSRHPRSEYRRDHRGGRSGHGETSRVNGGMKS